MSLDLSKAVASGLVFIGGEEEVIRWRRLKEVLATAEIAPEDFDFETITADAKPIGDWLASVTTLPFMSARRTVVVRNVLRVDPKEFEAKLKTKLPNESLLILVGDEEPGSDDRQRTFTTRSTAWAKLVPKLGGTFIPCSLDSRTFQSSIQQEVKAMGKKMGGQATVLLEEMTGSHFSRALRELEKVRLFVGDAPEIQAADVREVVAPSREWSIWSLIDSVAAPNPTQALKQLRIVLGSPTKIEEAANRNILPQLSRHFRLLFQARVCLDHGQTPPALSEQVLRQLPAKHIGLEKPFVINKIMGQARKLDRNACARGLTAIAEADGKLKGSLPGFNALDTMETLILQLCQTVGQPVAR